MAISMVEGVESKNIVLSLKYYGLDFEVEKVPLILADDNKQETGAWAIRKTVGGQVLGTVGKNYVPLQNTDAFKPFQAFLDRGFANVTDGGTFSKDSIVWMQAEIKSDPLQIVPGDEIKKFVLLSHGHNGKMAVRFGFTPIRVICQNTLVMANRSNNSELIRIKHSTNAITDIAAIEAAMELSHAKFNETARAYKALARKQISQDQLNAYIKEVFKLKAATIADKNKTEKVIDKITKLFETGMGMDIVGVRGTYWAAYNAVTEHLTHNKDAYDFLKRDESNNLGENYRINGRAFDLAMAMAI
jgi:phage/plasmid-like protein (TIGR03299 family)